MKLVGVGLECVQVLVNEIAGPSIRLRGSWQVGQFIQVMATDEGAEVGPELNSPAVEDDAESSDSPEPKTDEAPAESSEKPAADESSETRRSAWSSGSAASTR